MRFRHPMNVTKRLVAAGAILAAAGLCAIGGSLFGAGAVGGDGKYDPTALALEEISHRHVQPLDWPQWGGWTARNNTPPACSRASTSLSGFRPRRSRRRFGTTIRPDLSILSVVPFDDAIYHILWH